MAVGPLENIRHPILKKRRPHLPFESYFSNFRKMVNIFAYTCPNRSGVGAINNPDRSEQVFDAYYISEVS